MSATDTLKANIYNLYRGLTGTGPDTDSVNAWADQVQNNTTSLAALGEAFARLPAAAAATGADAQLQIRSFLDGIYQNLFGRGIDAQGLSAWTTQMLAGRSGIDVVGDIIGAAQSTDAAAMATRVARSGANAADAQETGVARLYQAFFGRAADAGGLANWTAQLRGGVMTLADIATAFAATQGGKAAFPYLDPTLRQQGATTFLTGVYRNLFGAALDASGLAAWSAELRAGKSPAAVVTAIIRAAQGSGLQAQADAALTPAPVVPSVSFALAADAASVAEGGTVVFTLTTTGVAAGTLYSYQITGVDAADVTGGSLTGTATIDSQGRALIGITLAADARTEGLETLRLTVADRAATVAVADTSLDTNEFTLSAGIDTVLGTARGDVITSNVAGGLGALDNIDGAGGIDTLTVQETAALTVTTQTKVSNVEVANLTSAAGITADTTGWSGLATLNTAAGGATKLTAASTTNVVAQVTATAANNTTIDGGSSVTVIAAGATTGSIAVGGTTAPTGAVSIRNTTAGSFTGSMGAVTVKGGTDVAIAQNATNAVNTTVTTGTVSVAGGAATRSVTVASTPRATASATVAGVNSNSVAITDINGGGTAAGTITTVSVSGYTTLSISDNALTDLSVAAGSSNIIIDNSGLATPTNTTLRLTANGLTGGTLDDADIYTTLNVTTVGTDSKLANITTGALKTLTVDGSKTLTLTSTAGLSALQTVTVGGTAGLVADLSSSGTVTKVDTSASLGASKLTIDASKASFVGGAGADRVTHTSGTVTKAISLGGGDDSLSLGSSAATPTAAINGGAGTDSLGMTASLAATASGSGAFAGLVTNFEQLVLTGATNQTIDLAVLGVTGQVSTSGGNGLTLSNFASGATLALTGAGTAYTLSNAAFTGGTNDVVNLALTDGSGAGVSFAATGITGSGVETYAITTADTQATPSGGFNDFVTLLGNSAKTTTVAGNAGLTLNQTSTALTTVDASGITLGNFTWTSGALTTAATVKGSASGANTVDASASTQSVTYTGGTGTDSVTLGSKNNTVALGAGTNSLTATSGNNTVTAGDGADTVNLTTGNNIVNLGNGANSFTATSGNNTYVGGNGVDTVSVGSGANVVTLGSGADIFSLTAVNTGIGVYSTITDAHAGLSMSFLNLGTETFTSAKVVLADTAIFRDFADAAVQAGGNSSVNGHFGWFTWAGDTFLVQSRHDDTGGTVGFRSGTDILLKLNGLVDLSGVTGVGTNTLTLV